MLKRQMFALCMASSLLAVDPAGIARLGGKVERDSAGRIVAVNLRGSWINDAEMAELSRLPDLERLDLSHTRITDEGMLNLMSAPKISDLKLFYSEWITDQGMSAIKGWKHLKRLDVRGTRISDGTIEIVSHMPGLEALDVAHTEVTNVGLENLITLINLRELAIGKGRLSSSGMLVLKMLPTLQLLDLSGASAAAPDNLRGGGGGLDLTEEALNALTELKELRTLYLGFSSVAPDQLRALSSLSKVEKLGLQGCPRVDDTAIPEIAKWKGLKFVDLQETSVTAQGLAELQKARPQLKVLSGGTRPPPPTHQ